MRENDTRTGKPVCALQHAPCSDASKMNRGQKRPKERVKLMLCPCSFVCSSFFFLSVQGIGKIWWKNIICIILPNRVETDTYICCTQLPEHITKAYSRHPHQKKNQALGLRKYRRPTPTHKSMH